MVAVALAGVVLLLVASIAIVGFQRAPAEAPGLRLPVAERIVGGKRVGVQVVFLGGVEPPAGAIDRAVAGFSDYVMGETIRAPDVVLPNKSIAWPVGPGASANSLLGTSLDVGPMDVVIIVAPRIDGFTHRGMSMLRPDGSRLILIDASRLDDAGALVSFKRARSYLVSRASWWELVVKHEMLHGLRVPADAGRVWAGGHCTSPACILYPTIDWRSGCRTVITLGPPMDLCGDCQRDVRAAQNAVRERAPDGIEHWDRLEEMNALVELNPDNALAYAFRGEELFRRGMIAEALRDQDRAIELDPSDARAYGERALSLNAQGDVVAAGADMLTCVKLGTDAHAADVSRRNLVGMIGHVLSEPRYGDDARVRMLELARELCDVLGVEQGIAEALSAASAAGEGLDEAKSAFRDAIEAAAAARLQP